MAIKTTETFASPELLSLAAQLSDRELMTRVKLLAHQEREATGVLIAHLAILDERRLYLAEGCSSLFTYCTQVLHLSEYAAYSRIEAARAARKYPVILELLTNGSVNLTTVGLLAPHFTPENHAGLLEEARHKSKRQVEELVARLRPQPAVPSTIRRLPSQNFSGMAAGQAPVPAPTTGGGTNSQSGSDAAELAPPPAAPSPARPAAVTPLAPERYKVQFTASAETHAKLRLAQDLMRHQVPDGDLGEIIDRALTVLLRDLTKQKIAATERVQGDKVRGSGDCGTHDSVPGSRRISSRHIPAEVRRAVWARDGGRCAFVAPNGRRCTEQGFLEFHHVVPYGVGGEATVDNIELRCRGHNGHEAELYFGRRTVITPSTRSGPS